MKTHETKEEKRIEASTNTKEEKKEKIDKASQKYSGIAINQADNNKVTEKLEKERTCTLNNNRGHEAG